MWHRRINVGIIVVTSLLLGCVLFPLIQRARETARRTQSQSNLKMIGLALFNYHDSFNCFPAGGIFNDEGRGYHGWMTSILPHLDDHPLYNSINLNEVWDSTKNAGSFLNKVPIYKNPGERPAERVRWQFPLAHYSANARIMAANSFTAMKSIANSSSVFLVGELSGDFVPWGCPYNWRELNALNSDPPTYGRTTRDGCQFLFPDGRVEFVVNDVSSDILKRMRGEDLTGFNANELELRRPSAFPCPTDAIWISWKWESPKVHVTIREDVHGNVTSERIVRGEGSK